MSDRSVTFLKDRRTGELVEAALIDGVSRQEVESRNPPGDLSDELT